MKDVKQFVIDYIEGRVESKAFLEEMQKNPEITDWLQTLVPEGTTRTIYWPKRTVVPYIVKDALHDTLTAPGSSVIGRELNVHYEIYCLVNNAFPELKLKYDKTLNDKHLFMLDACPEYLDSPDIASAGIYDKLMDELPKEMSKTKKIKEFRKRLKEMFYIEGHKHPHWIQDSEWPLSKTGKPTKYLRCKNAGELSYYYFLDMDTGEEIVVTQAY